MGHRFGLAPLKFENWNQAFLFLANLTAHGKVIILLDEISWMANEDKDFTGKLKGVYGKSFPYD
jgi:hypothetical protein